ncbi:MAG: hypothetical protein Q8S11_04235 [Daejeonella sp.]|uniref:hypothetical protein n=1 Tax=Daejeonella sp. TaxID=2805397 RepID=UPI002734569F|nr:hypothetical protein [Daejeonella sp.]MDP3467514.1 hypothetical protein [Daejeonella sp.]
MGNIAFVASTLPVPLLKAKSGEWDICEIVMTGVSLQQSYEYFVKDKPHIKLSVVPKQHIAGWFFIIRKLLSVKLSNTKVYFFHECCWFNFDVVIDIIRAKGEFYPQVTLNSFRKVEGVPISSIYHRKLVHFLGMSRDFVEYEVPHDNNAGSYYVLSKVSYGNNILHHRIEDSISARRAFSTSLKKSTSNILIILASETVSDEALISTYRSLTDELTLRGFQIFTKNHPREEGKLPLPSHLLFNEIPNHIPIELVDQDFVAVIGCASTALVSFGSKAFSVIKFCGMTEDLVKRRIDHLGHLPGEIQINFPTSLSDLILSIENLRKNAKILLTNKMN